MKEDANQSADMEGNDGTTNEEENVSGSIAVARGSQGEAAAEPSRMDNNDEEQQEASLIHQESSENEVTLLDGTSSTMETVERLDKDEEKKISPDNNTAQQPSTDMDGDSTREIQQSSSTSATVVTKDNSPPADAQQSSKLVMSQEATSSADVNALSNDGRENHADDKSHERNRGGAPTRFPGAVAVSSSELVPNRSEPERGLAAVPALSTVAAVATILPQPVPYRQDNDPLDQKNDERVDRFVSGGTVVPGAVATLPIEASPGNTDVVNETEDRSVASQDEDDSPSSRAEAEVSSSPYATHREMDPASALVQNQMESSPLVTATPIDAIVLAEAIQVTIDEESGDYWSGQEHQAVPESDADKPNSCDWKSKSCRFHVLIVLFAMLTVAAVVLAVVLPLSNNDESVVDPDSMNRNGRSPDEELSFDYPCYTSTLQILVDQLEDVDRVNDTYVICPNTTISVGTLANPEADVYYFVGGDYPIWPVYPGITVQCGKDGRSENNCTLEGGFLQVTMLPTIPLPPQYSDHVIAGIAHRLESLARENRTEFLENVTIRGITFTGRTQHTGPFSGVSVSVSQSGTYSFQDCHWRDMSLSYGLIEVAQNTYLKLKKVPMPTNSMDVKVINSSFADIIFGAPLAMADSQSLSFDHCLFRQLIPSAIAFPSCTLFDTIRVDGGCAGLMYCASEASCSISNSCLQRSSTTGPALVYFAHNTTDGSMLNNFWDGNPSEVCEWAVRVESFDSSTGDGQDPICLWAFEADRCNLD